MDAPPTNEMAELSVEDQAAAAAAASAASAAKDAKAAATLLKQVEFYFGDDNLPTDAFMIKQVTSNAEGWVGVNVIGTFKKIKSLKMTMNKISEVLRVSTELEVSEDGKRVRRVAPLPEMDSPDVQERTVVAENLPKEHTVESLTALFSAVGTVKALRVYTADEAAAQTSKPVLSIKEHALVEYADVRAAARAVKELTDSDNWRFGLRVKPTVQQLSGKDAKLAAAKEKATLKAAKLLEEVLAVGEAEAGGKPRKTREEVEALVVSGKPRKTREEVEALVVSGKLYATVRTQLCKPFSQGRTCEHGAKCFFAHGEAELRRAAACAEADGDEAKVAVEGKPRLTTHEVEAMVSSGKLPASARTRLCKHFTQGLPCVHGENKCHFAHGDTELREDASAAEECEGNDVATTEWKAGGRKGKGRRDYAAWASAGAWKSSQATEGAPCEGDEGAEKAKEARPRRLILQPRTAGLVNGTSIQAAVLSSGAGTEPVKPDGGKGFTRGRGKPVTKPPGLLLPEALLAAPGRPAAAEAE